ncbi:hypothetical protein E1B28_005953 [Marasmius oreades]|uniref:Uncharacterized protein n=1 Tax=Marasmius oreades TaxID=181124 RepID=A0A9P7S4B6_9AGAR|nr:uncharacterized protein E1B28_005953 [Marasmius oreades]KAG7095174.1 hypothetical protein E1B28_005953 [Marasmius oreades]
MTNKAPMSARQNKKQRKGRNPHQHRERTVTTLTGDSDTVFSTNHSKNEDLTPTTMPHTFNPAISAGFAFNNLPANIPKQAQYMTQSHVTLPPGETDLEKLENLKQIIKNGQHELYTTVPNPIALAQLYLGDIDSGQQIPQLVSGSTDDAATRPPRLQSKDSMRKAVSGTAAYSSASQILDEQASQTRPSAGSGSAFSGFKASNYPAEVKPLNSHETLGDEPIQESSVDDTAPLSARISRPDDNFEPRSGAERPYPDDFCATELMQQDSVTLPPSNGSIPPSTGSRGRYHDPREHDRVREREVWDRDRSNSDLRYGKDERRLSDARRHELDSYSLRRYDPNEEERHRDERDRLNPRPLDESVRFSSRLEDRERDFYPHQRPDDRNHDRREYVDHHHGPSFDTRVPLTDARVTSSPSQMHPLSSSSTTVLSSGPAHRNSVEDRTARPPSIPSPQLQAAAEELRAPTLEERMSTRVPTLKERLSQPSMRGGPAQSQQSGSLHNSANSVASAPGRQPTLEQRISQGPGGVNTNVTGSDALKRPTCRDLRDRTLSGPEQAAGPPRMPASNSAGLAPPTPDERGRSLSRDFNSNAPTSPDTPVNTSSRYPSRTDSVVRESGNGSLNSHVKSSSVSAVARGSSPATSVQGRSNGRHDNYRPVPLREPSRERHSGTVPPPGTNGYMPDEKTYLDQDRDRERMDLDSRYSDRYNGRYSPRDRPRPLSNAVGRTYPSPPNQPPTPYDDRDRRMPPPPPAPRDYPPNPPYEYSRDGDRRKDWSTAEEDVYWKSSRPAYPPLDRERYEREPQPSSSSLLPPPSRSALGWETRDEHDSRRSAQLNIYPPARSPTRDPRPSYDSRSYYDRPRYDLGTPNPHGHPQSAVALAASARIRQRSPSPKRSANPTLDDRPPLKRPRDDSYPSGPGIYSRPRESTSLSVSGRYPPDYDSRPIPSGERAEYRRPEYPGSYDRPRSPARSVGGYTSNYRPDPRDDRRYVPPPQPR